MLQPVMHRPRQPKKIGVFKCVTFARTSSVFVRFKYRTFTRSARIEGVRPRRNGAIIRISSLKLRSRVGAVRAFYANSKSGHRYDIPW